MALNPSTAFPGRTTAPSAGYPYGSSKNESSAGAGDGTPYELIRADDVFGFQQALLNAAGIVPSGSADTILDSQYLKAVKFIVSTNIYVNDVNYAVGSKALGSDGTWYEAAIVNGPGSSVVSPIADATATWLYASRMPPGFEFHLGFVPTATQLIQMGALERGGQNVLDVDYPKLLTFWGGKLYGNVDGSHFYLPDDRGKFERIWDHGASVDPDVGSRTNRGDGTVGDNVGTNQDDATVLHVHQELKAQFGNVAGGTGSIFEANSISQKVLNAGSASPPQSPTGKTETRPINTYKFGGIFVK